MVGAGSGIGAATLEAFLAEGARVAVLERNAEKCAELAEEHPEVLVIPGDACSAADNRHAVRETVKEMGGLDSAINFVGIHDLRIKLRDLEGEQLRGAFEEVFAINVRSALELAAAAETALRADRGSLLLTLSNSAFHPGSGGVLYVASKFALRGVINQLAHEWAPHIRVNGVAPGGTLGTDLRGLASIDAASRRTADDPARTERIRGSNPLHLAPGAGDHAAAYVYLASSRSPAVTGETISSDGGLAVR